MCRYIFFRLIKGNIPVFRTHEAGILLGFFIILVLAPPSVSQSGSFWDDTDLTLFRTGGSIGLTASTYAAHGIENRRPPGVLQTNAAFNFLTLGLRSGLNLNYSTDDSGLRQNMNTLSYSARWRWLSFQVGDVNTRFSDYSLNGTTIRGGHIRANPGNFLVEVIGGKSKRAVRPSLESAFREPSFDQWAFGAKVGMSGNRGSFFNLNTFYAQDNAASLSGEIIEIKPQENLTITPDFRVNLFSGRLTVESQFTASVFTRDLEGDPFSSSNLDIPGFVTTIYQPRVTTHINYAGKAMAGFRSDLLDLNIGYERIQPGFMSLGRGTVRNDIETITLSPSLSFFQNRLSIRSDVTLGRDNLLGTRFQTQSNTGIGTNVQVVFNETIHLTTSYNLLLNDITMNQIEGFEQPVGGQSQVSHNVMVQPNFTILGEDFIHNIAVTGGYLSINSAFTGDPQNTNSFSSVSYTGMLSYAITLPAGLTLNSSGNYLTNSSNGGDIRNIGLNFGTSYALFNRKLTLGLNLGINRNKLEREVFNGPLLTNRLQQLTGGINTSYRLTNKDTFNLTIRSRNSRVLDGTGNDFTELEGSFRYQRTF
ncbi:MAG: hypothetical protein EA359_01545 [Balneolaceae bacterium]|nr:MAG: hypothetical protein EA359_01545 [Balneolaceae bacterium]